MLNNNLNLRQNTIVNRLLTVVKSEKTGSLPSKISNKDSLKAILNSNLSEKGKLAAIKSLVLNLDDKTTKVKGKINSKRPKGKASGLKERKSPRHLTWEFKHKFENLPYVLNCIYPEISIPTYVDMVNYQKKYITRLVQNHGFSMAATKYKSCRQYIFGLIEGKDVSKEHPLFTSSHDLKGLDYLDDWLPIAPLVLKASEEPAAYAALNTLLYMTRVLEEMYERDNPSITAPMQQIEPELLNEFRTYVQNEFKSKRVYDYVNSLMQDITLKFGINNNSNGPNSKKRLVSVLREILFIMDKSYESTFIHLKVLAEKFTNGVSFIRYMESFLNTDIMKSFKALIKGTKLRKIVPITAPDMKMREVAISDYWTQTILAPFEGVIYAIFEKFFPTVALSSHDRGFANAIALSNKYKLKYPMGLYSYDISDWTDRFHRDVQFIVFEELFGKDSCEAWKSLVVECPWHLGDKVVYYAQGQGMGTRGSMAIATLSYILYINFTLEQAYKGEFKEEWSGVVGDDLYCLDYNKVIPSAFARIYLPINNKGKTPTVKGRFVEFVSRVAWNEVDVSRLSGRVINNSKDWRNIPALVICAEKRRINIPASSLVSLYNIVKKDRDSYLSKVHSVFYFLNAEQSIIANYLTLTNEPNKYLKKVRDRLFNIDKEYLYKNGYLPRSSLSINGVVYELDENLSNLYLVSKFISGHIRLATLMNETIQNITKVPLKIRSLLKFRTKSNFMDPKGEFYNSLLEHLNEVHPELVLGKGTTKVIHPNALINIQTLIQAVEIRDRLTFGEDLLPVYGKNFVRNSIVNYCLQSKIIENFFFDSLKSVDVSGDNLVERTTFETIKVIGSIDFEKRTYTIPKGFPLDDLTYILDEIKDIGGFPTLVDHNGNVVYRFNKEKIEA
jgi:hypothetical protein